MNPTPSFHSLATAPRAPKARHFAQPVSPTGWVFYS